MKHLGLVFAVLTLAFIGGWLYLPQLSPAKKPPFNVLVVGWDGSRLERIEQLLAENKLPVLKKLISQGSFVKVNITDGRTDTKAGWTQIFTGYNAAVTGVHSNRDYRPIPPGYTVFERLIDKFHDGIATLFISGKVNNIGARGPHKVCINCKSRFDDTHGKTQWWDENSEAPTKKGLPREYSERAGEPYFNAAKRLHLYKNDLGEAANVAAFAIESLRQIQGRNFFAFVHFEEPDEMGHLNREGSISYLSAIEEADRRTGELLVAIAQMKFPGELRVFIASDHGFNRLEHGHGDAPETFLASTVHGLEQQADRRDFTPTILKMYDFALDTLQPKLNGRPLLQ